MEHIAGKNMGSADYMSRHPNGKAHEISQYDQSFSVAIIQKLKPMLQACKMKVKRTTDENRDVSEIDRQVPLERKDKTNTTDN